jgi:hypothetical protein
VAAGRYDKVDPADSVDIERRQQLRLAGDRAWTGSAAIIAAIDSGGDLHYWWQANGTTEWHKQFVASGLSPNVPATIAWTGTAAVIAAVDSSGSINYWWQANGATQWNPQLVAQAGITVEPWEGPSHMGRRRSRRRTIMWASSPWTRMAT